LKSVVVVDFVVRVRCHRELRRSPICMRGCSSANRSSLYAPAETQFRSEPPHGVSSTLRHTSLAPVSPSLRATHSIADPAVRRVGGRLTFSGSRETRRWAG
jgi:hypothetical protein